MNKPKAQGTAWESEFVRRAQEAGHIAARYAEGGSSDVADVWIGDPQPAPGDITVLAWKRLVGDGRRTPDGERDVIVIRTDDFFRILDHLGSPVVHVECKATQALNVTRTLFKARGKVAKAIRRREAA